MVIKNINFVRPRLADLMNFLADNVLLGLNCHHICTIQSFDATLQTAVATVDYQKVIPQLNETTGIVTPLLVPYPPLVDCPVKFAFGGTGGVTVPVNPGDKALAAFNDRDMDAWFAGTVNSGPNTARLHSFSDAVLLVGIRPPTNPIKNFDNTRPMLRDESGRTIVALSADGTKINLQNSSQNVATLLQNILTQLESLAAACAVITVPTTGGPSGVPLNAATFTSIQTQLSTLATDLAEVLE